MRSVRIIVFALAAAALSLHGNNPPGLTAFRENNYGAAIRLLPAELTQTTYGTKEYFELFFAYVESLLYNGRTAEAEKELKKNEANIPPEFKPLFDLLSAKFLYAEKKLKKSEDLLKSLQLLTKTSAKIKYDSAVLLCEIYLASDRANEAEQLLNDIMKDASVISMGEFSLRFLELRTLAASGKLNMIPSKFEDIRKKFPAQQGRLEHFQLLIHAINQDLKAYRELFLKIFPDERPMRAFIGDNVLYQGALLAEQEAQKEKKTDEIAFHLKNQTFFAPDDEYRAASFKMLIELYLNAGRKKDALSEVHSMLKNIPNVKEKTKWEMTAAKLQNELNINDRGLQIYLKIKNDTAANDEIRAEAAKAAADIYRSSGNKTEMLKLYAFLTGLPGNRKINDEGTLLTGKYYFENKEYRMGESVFAGIASDSELYPETLFYLIQCQIANGEFESAIKNIQQITLLKNTQKNKDIPEFELAAVYFRAMIAEAMNKDDEAAALYEQAARLNSKHPASVKILINSWLKAAELQYKRQSFSNAGLLFLSFAERFPENANTSMALYKSVYSYFLAGRFDEMKYSIDKLKKDFPGDKLTINALFHKMDHYRQNGDLQNSLKILSEIESENKDKNPAVSAQILYDKALTFYQLQRDKDALNTLMELKKYQTSEYLAEGLFLAGTIFFDQGDNVQAAEYFMQASTLRKDPLFNSVCRGRAADSYFVAGTKSRNNTFLNQSADIYKSLIKEENPPLFQLQCFYKWGRTLEALEDYQGALDAYTEVLYLPYIEKSAEDTGVVPVWVNRSALNAIEIHLRQGGTNALNDAIFIIRRLKKLNTMTARELEDLEINVRNRYIQHD